MLQENSSPNFQQETEGVGVGVGLSQVHWRPEKLFTADSSSNDFKQVVNRGFSLDQTQFSPQYSSGDSNVTSQSLPCNFQIDHSYGNSSILQGLLGPDQSNNHQQPQQGSFENRPMNNFPYSPSYGFNNSNNELVPSWSKVPQFLRASPPKQPQANNQLHFTNNAPFWNASEAPIKDARSTFFPSLQSPFPTPSFDTQSKVLSHEILACIDIDVIALMCTAYGFGDQ